MKNDEKGFCGMSGLVEGEQKCMIASWIDTELSTMLFMPVVMIFWRGLVSGLRLAIDMHWHCQILSLLRSGDRFVVKTGISGSSSACLYFEYFVVRLPKAEPILEAKAMAVWLDRNYRPVCST
ncbi:hypothetical protein D5086_016484 [Populus alba]|uniref:Uncharacterized protein n=1 Tax=Populus alba TaxID=43335 RepID=A0ACC4BUQ2_POPAL